MLASAYQGTSAERNPKAPINVQTVFVRTPTIARELIAEQDVTDLPRSALKVIHEDLCAFANQDGYSWPSISTLAKMNDMAEKTVRRAIAALEQLGIIVMSQPANPKLNRPTVWFMPYHATQQAAGKGHLHILPPVPTDTRVADTPRAEGHQGGSQGTETPVPTDTRPPCQGAPELESKNEKKRENAHARVSSLNPDDFIAAGVDVPRFDRIHLPDDDTSRRIVLSDPRTEEVSPGIYRHPLADGDSTDPTWWRMTYQDISNEIYFPKDERHLAILEHTACAATWQLIERLHHVPASPPNRMPTDVKYFRRFPELTEEAKKLLMGPDDFDRVMTKFMAHIPYQHLRGQEIISKARAWLANENFQPKPGKWRPRNDRVLNEAYRIYITTQ